MTADHRPTLRVRGPADLIATVPYLLGFHPVRSMVTVALTERRIALLTRTDLPQHGTPRPNTRDGLSQLAEIVLRQSPEAVMLLWYGDNSEVAPAAESALAVFAEYGVPVTEKLRVTGSRYYFIGCDGTACHGTGCCPPEGFPFDPDASSLPAQAAYAGLVARPSRAALAATLAPVTGGERDAMREATGQAWDRIGELTGNVPGELSSGVPAAGRLQRQLAALAPAQRRRAEQRVREAGEEAVRHAFAEYLNTKHAGDGDIAWLTVLLSDTGVRDHAIQHTRSADAGTQIQFWSAVTRRAEPGLAPAPACLLAVAALQDGNGALAEIAISRALDAGPGYQLAVLLSALIRQGISPADLCELLDTAAAGAASEAAPRPPAGQ